MTTTPSTLREHFPEFSDLVLYPDPMVQFWLDTAAKLHNADRWGELLDVGCELFAAHNIAISALDNSSGASPGMVAAGIITSQAVGGASVGMDASSTTEENAGNWNLTSYGTRWIRFSRMVGAGPVYVGGPTDADSSSISTAAWPGPYTSYF